FWKSRPAADSTSARHISTIAFADSGGAAPRSCSRAIRPITSAIGASSLVLIRALPRWSERWRHSADRLSATPAMRRAPNASTRTCSTASKIERAVSPRGTRRRCILRSWWRSFSAIESASPRTRLTSSVGRSRAGTVMRASWPRSEPPSGTNETFTSLRHRAHGGGGDSAELLERSRVLGHWRALMQLAALAAAGRQLLAEAALIVLGERAALDLVALVEEGETEGEAHIAGEDARILGPGDHRARRHHGRNVAGDEAGAGEIGERHHRGDDLAAVLVV